MESNISALFFFMPVTSKNRLWTKSPGFEESFLLPVKASTWAQGLLVFRHLSHSWEIWNHGKVLFHHHKRANLLSSSRRSADDEFHRKSGAQLQEPGLLFDFYTEDIQKSGVPQVLVNRNKIQCLGSGQNLSCFGGRNNICNFSYCCQYIFKPNIFKQLLKAVEWDTGSITVELCHVFKAMMW